MPQHHPRPKPEPDAELLYGRQAVRESLRAQRRRFVRLFVAKEMRDNEAVTEIGERARKAGVAVEAIERSTLDGWLMGANHQGVVLRAGPYPYAEIDQTLVLAQTRSEPPFLLLLDRVQDPQNLGSLLRTAEACGVHGIILPRHRAAGVTPAVVNASAGAVEHLLICQETNLVTTMQRLKQQGLWFAGLEADPRSVPYQSADLGGPLGVVVGSEGFGLSRLVAETCDWLLALPMRGRIQSLNAAVAGSVLLFFLAEKRSGQG